MTIEDLSARLEKVERQNRRMRAVGIAVLVLVAAGAAMGQAAPAEKVIRAGSFQVVNTGGAIIASLGVDENERSALNLYAENGKPQVALIAERKGGAVLSFFNKGETKRAELTTRPGIGTTFVLLGDSEQHWVNLSLSTIGAGVAVGDGRVSAALNSVRGQSEIYLKGERQAKVVSLTQTEEGLGSLVLSDKDGKVIERLPK